MIFWHFIGLTRIFLFTIISDRTDTCQYWNKTFYTNKDKNLISYRQHFLLNTKEIYELYKVT